MANFKNFKMIPKKHFLEAFDFMHNFENGGRCQLPLTPQSD